MLACINVVSNFVLSTWILNCNDPFIMLPCTSYTTHRTEYVKGIHQWPMNSPHKGTVVWKTFPCRAIVKSCSAHIVCMCFMMRTIYNSVHYEDVIVYSMMWLSGAEDGLFRNKIRWINMVVDALLPWVAKTSAAVRFSMCNGHVGILWCTMCL